MKHIVLMPNRQKDPGFSLTLRVIDILRRHGAVVYIEQEYTELLLAGAVGYAKDRFPSAAEAILVLGGDGTILHAAAIALRHNIPLLGVNLGRLGYLASLEPEDVEMLGALCEDAYTEKRRMTLDVTLRRQDGDVHFDGYVLNDVVVSGGGRLADIGLYDGDDRLDYRADGLILATPTGSTAYSLSAGGAVLDEGMEAICVTPICPRSFFSRSLLFSPDAVLRIVNGGERVSSLRVTLDGDSDIFLEKGDELIVRRSTRALRILLLKPRSLLNVLRKKMNMQNF